MTDIALDTKGDIMINSATGEIEFLKESKDAILQRKKIELSSSPASLVDAPYEGALIHREVTLNKRSLANALRFYEKVFGQDEEIDPDSIQITPVIQNDGGYKFHTSFKTLEGEAINALVI